MGAPRPAAVGHRRHDLRVVRCRPCHGDRRRGRTRRWRESSPCVYRPPVVDLGVTALPRGDAPAGRLFPQPDGAHGHGGRDPALLAESVRRLDTIDPGWTSTGRRVDAPCAVPVGRPSASPMRWNYVVTRRARPAASSSPPINSAFPFGCGWTLARFVAECSTRRAAANGAVSRSVLRLVETSASTWSRPDVRSGDRERARRLGSSRRRRETRLALAGPVFPPGIKRHPDYQEMSPRVASRCRRGYRDLTARRRCVRAR